jgi:hypothetical protein
LASAIGHDANPAPGGAKASARTGAACADSGTVPARIQHGTPMREWRSPLPPVSHTPMEIEQVNAIGTLLADLSERTEQLRGYL